MTNRTVRRSWSEEDVRRLRLLAHKKIKLEYIANELNRSVASVKLKAY